MPRNEPLPEELTPLGSKDLDRLAVDKAGNLYLDNKRIATYDLFEAFGRSSRRTKIISSIVAIVAFLGGLSLLIERGLAWNDRYCWIEPLYSNASECAESEAAPGPSVGDTTG